MTDFNIQIELGIPLEISPNATPDQLSLCQEPLVGLRSSPTLSNITPQIHSQFDSDKVDGDALDRGVMLPRDQLHVRAEALGIISGDKISKSGSHQLNIECVSEYSKTALGVSNSELRSEINDSSKCEYDRGIPSPRMDRVLSMQSFKNNGSVESNILIDEYATIGAVENVIEDIAPQPGSCHSRQSSSAKTFPVNCGILCAEAPKQNLELIEAALPATGLDPPEVVDNQSTKVLSNLKHWQNKRYLGGYRRGSTEFFHAIAQTTTPQEIKAANAGLRFHRDCQTVYESIKSSQTLATNSTQMTKGGCFVSSTSDYVINARAYVSADTICSIRNGKAIIIQCFIRQALSRIKYKKLFRVKEERNGDERKKSAVSLIAIEQGRIFEIERRTHPRTPKDFEILFSDFEKWRSSESNRINSDVQDEFERKFALSQLLDEETNLLKKIDQLMVIAKIKNQEESIDKLLDTISAPKLWNCDSGVVMVDTPATLRARFLKNLYQSLNKSMPSVDKRLEVLGNVKSTVNVYKCELSRDMTDLIDREGEMLYRQRPESSLLGLRKRISTLFLQFVRCPEYNPEMEVYAIKA